MIVIASSLICVFFFLQNPEEVIQNERSIKYKLIELQNMAIYWDTDVTLVGDWPSRDLEVRKVHSFIHKNSMNYAYSIK